MWGAPQTEPAHWSLRKTLAAVGIAAVLAGVGAAVIYAAAGTTQQGGPGLGGPGFGGPGGPPGSGPGGFGGGQSSITNSLHGEFVVADGRGGYATELTQTGVVTDISNTTVTARSDDGFTQTYTITPETRHGRTEVKAGEPVTIRAVTADGITTATVISPAD
ncbi:MAG: hypothetical protein K0R68_2381 [Mycobacterium sp.]|nr:hypothetical protein [Mycobacterium sp.]